jgi:hypothetical protein
MNEPIPKPIDTLNAAVSVVETLDPAVKPLVVEAEAEATGVFSFLHGMGVPTGVAYGVTAVVVAVSAALAAHYSFHLF